MEMAIGEIGRVWWEGRSLLEDFTAHWEGRIALDRDAPLFPFLFTDERMALRLYRIMAMTKLCYK